MDHDVNVDKLHETITKLENKIDCLTRENQQLKNQLSERPLLVMGNETDLYPGEIKDIILSTLSRSISTDGSRRNDVIRDIITNNHYEELGKTRMAKLKQALKKYNGMDRNVQSSLRELGIDISVAGHNKHFVGTYYKDARYRVIFPSTPSDYRAGMNLASNVIRICL